MANQFLNGFRLCSCSVKGQRPESEPEFLLILKCAGLVQGQVQVFVGLCMRVRHLPLAVSTSCSWRRGVNLSGGGTSLLCSEVLQ